MRRAWKAAASAAGMLAVLAGCSGGSNGAVDPTVTATSPAESSTTVPSTKPTQVPTSTTAPPPTTTSAAPTTTAAPPEPQVRTDYLRLYDAYWACLRSPSTCDPSTLTSTVGTARAALTKTVTDLVSGGLAIGSEDPGYVVVESVTLNGPTTALVTSCWWDTGVLYGPPAQVGGAPIIINDLKVTSRFETTMTFEGDRWLTSEEKRVGRVEGVNQCPPEG